MTARGAASQVEAFLCVLRPTLSNVRHARTARYVVYSGNSSADGSHLADKVNDKAAASRG